MSEPAAIACPACGSIETEANTFEAWCADCGWRITEADPAFAGFRAATLAHRQELAAAFDRMLAEGKQIKWH